jgi:hypothetical protein
MIAITIVAVSCLPFRCTRRAFDWGLLLPVAFWPLLVSLPLRTSPKVHPIPRGREQKQKQKQGAIPGRPTPTQRAVRALLGFRKANPILDPAGGRMDPGGDRLDSMFGTPGLCAECGELCGAVCGCSAAATACGCGVCGACWRRYDQLPAVQGVRATSRQH